MYLRGRLYLGQLIFSNNPLSEGYYIVNLMSTESLSTRRVDEVRTK
jgi:hypothetical protein